MKKQMTKFNQRRAEKPFVKKVQTPVHETVNPVAEQELLKIGWNDYEELITCKQVDYNVNNLHQLSMKTGSFARLSLHFSNYYISRPCSSSQRLEMTFFEVAWRT